MTSHTPTNTHTKETIVGNATKYNIIHILQNTQARDAVIYYLFFFYLCSCQKY
jgi:hypothetical protein